ncbi:Fibrillarin and related nucleolar RNA-binding proteins [Klebsormidium nitens]|uniref:Fibrillarin and related nucleolar RNA-binding proteins n=1 Tax=Klebsormidium nitens TaxID=105231 RepID=A0A1Y1HY02_KLENI|nr:Fibrillarin and related nucleolar RNA-binding proteins [Klebsormidium nitens]|eukprot:GAQ83550.1 Fibrillarin and related nucleolar RNA-binding proteins [Klebsormidium nitens]
MERKHAWAWLLGGTVAAGFGRGLQAIPVVAWLEPVFFLQFFHHSRVHEVSWRSKLGILAAAIFAQAAGLTFAMAGTLNDPSFTPLGVAVVAIAATLGSTALVLIPYFGASAYRHRYEGAVAAGVFFFPLVLTGLWIAYARVSPFGTMGHSAYSQSDSKTLVLTASFWGMSGITFLMSWGAALLHEVLLCQNPVPPPKLPSPRNPPLPYTGAPYLHSPLLLRRYSVVEPHLQGALPQGVTWHVRAFSAVFLLALLYGGAQTSLFAGRFYQRGIEEMYHKTFAASCILEDEARGGSLERLWAETEGRVAAGDDVILWSETAAIVLGDAEEAALIARASALAQLGVAGRDTNKPGPYIGLSYYKVLDGQTPHKAPDQTRHVQQHEGPAGKALQNGLSHSSSNHGPSYEALSEVQESHIGTSALSGASEEIGSKGIPRPSVWGTAADVITAGVAVMSDGTKTLAARNSFVLVGPSGDPILKYNKTHTVPLEEDEVVQGDGRLMIAETGLGTMSAAICFDFRFPELMRQAGQKSVALMLQPAWTWGPVGLIELYAGAFRAVENGFHLFRCGSSGYSAAVSPLYDFEFVRETLTNGTITAQLPILPHVPTFYASYGFVLEYVCVILGAFVYLLAVLPRSAIGRVSKYWPAQLRESLFGPELDFDNSVESRGASEGSSAYTSLQ